MNHDVLLTILCHVPEETTVTTNVPMDENDPLGCSD